LPVWTKTKTNKIFKFERLEEKKHTIYSKEGILMTAKNMDKVWKVFTVVLGVVIMPLAGWVWNTNVAMAQLDNDLGDIESALVGIENKVEEAEINSRAIISIEKDIEYMKAALTRIERLVADP